ncbi:hypothetical protein [Vibrio crassostreae]|uniref:hypothetical protein n=1 Tax=Vibrio crassostreae TaxID=246167 RepID=UPI001B306E3E|nr:hypothetical protein [Vibrio crassostreae]
MRYIAPLLLAATLAVPATAEVTLKETTKPTVEQHQADSKRDKDGERKECKGRDPIKLFNKADLDSNGVLSQDEFLKLSERMKARKGKHHKDSKDESGEKKKKCKGKKDGERHHVKDAKH